MKALNVPYCYKHASACPKIKLDYVLQEKLCPERSKSLSEIVLIINKK